MAADLANPNRAEAAASHYRPDIDGLRAMAVLPVVFYHFGVPPFTGGYVGVDVFFVISGFLITSLIRDETAHGKFSFASFYERRIRRIFPALVAMLLASVAAGLVLLLPDDLIRFGASLTATSVFGSNFRFWHEAGYFDIAAELKPLLHTWSLAVEEQFYLLFPLVLFLLRRASRKIVLAAIAVLLVLSLGDSIWAVRHSPVAAFYLLPSRLWELMVGAILAIGAWQAPKRPWNELSVAAGLILIAVAIFGYDAATPFPGLTALPPCLGAALVIQGGSGGTAALSRVLGWRGLVWVGLISYSLYLWHWPVLIFARQWVVGEPGVPLKIVLLAISVILAVLSWRYVERPFRGRRSPVARRTLFAGAAASILALALFGAVPKWTHGLPQRYPAEVRTIFAEIANPGFKGCTGHTLDRIRQGKLCRLGDKNAGSPRFLLWGDLHAGAVAGAANSVALRHHVAGQLATEAACPPLLGVTPYNGGRADKSCPQVNDEIAKIAADPAIETVVLAGRWALNAEGSGSRGELHAPRLLVDSETPTPSLANNQAVFERGLRRTVAALVAAKKKIVVVAGIPEIGADVPEMLTKIELRGLSRDIRPSLDDYRARQKFVLGVLDRLVKDFRVTVIHPDTILCASGKCAVEIGGRPLYRDSQHLTEFGAAQLVPMFESVIR